MALKLIRQKAVMWFRKFIIFGTTMNKMACILILVLTLPVLDGCLKKAEEDPFVSLRTRKNRLVGQWTITKYEIQGENYLAQIYDTSYYDALCQSDRYYHEEWIISGRFDFAKDGGFDFTQSLNAMYTVQFTNTNYCKDYGGEIADEHNSSGEWDFTVGKKELVILYDDGFFSFYDIDKLSNQELKLSVSTNDFNVVIECVKKKE